MSALETGEISEKEKKKKGNQLILSQSSLGGRWMIDFHITKLTTEFIVQWISKTRRFNPRLGQKSNPIHLKN